MKNNRRTSAWPPNLIPVWVYTEVLNIIISELKSIMNHIMTWNYHTFWANEKCQTFKMNVFYLLWLCFYSLWFFNIYIKYDVLDEFVYWSMKLKPHTLDIGLMHYLERITQIQSAELYPMYIFHYKLLSYNCCFFVVFFFVFFI